MSDSESCCLSRGRALLVLGRVSNLPTVWSNCFVAFVLSGGNLRSDWAFLMTGATFFYLGGMFLNDAFDADFDRQFRKERPIPSGAVSERAVWILGGLQLAFGFFCFSATSRAPYGLSLLLGVSILVYNAAHKAVSWSPFLMALCRFFLFLAVASVRQAGVTGTVLWSAIALSSYIVGLSYVARRESSGELISWWPCLFLAFPAILAFAVNDGVYRVSGLATILVYAGWTFFCLRGIYWTSQPNISMAVSRLLAGIVWVDLMALGLGNAGQTVLMVGFFGAALLLQKFVPAT